MTKHNFTVFLIPDDEGYQAIIPRYTEAITGGNTPRDNDTAQKPQRLGQLLDK